MRIVKVPYHKVEIPILNTTSIELQPEPSSYVRFKTITIELHPREIDGKVIMAAYNRDTDTLYIQEELQ